MTYCLAASLLTLLFAFLPALASGRLASSQAKSQCPPANFTTVADFDLESFIQKRWYIQQQMPVFFLPKTQNRCVYADYSLRSSKGIWGYDVAVHNHAEDVDAPHAVKDSGSSICAKIVDKMAGKLEVAPCFLPSFIAGPYWVLAYSKDEGYALISGGAPTHSFQKDAAQARASIIQACGSSRARKSEMRHWCRSCGPWL